MRGGKGKCLLLFLVLYTLQHSGQVRNDSGNLNGFIG